MAKPCLNKKVTVNGWYATLVIIFGDSLLAEQIKRLRVKSGQEWRDNFLLQSKLSIADSYLASISPHVTAVACKTLQ